MIEREGVSEDGINGESRWSGEVGERVEEEAEKVSSRRERKGGSFGKKRDRFSVALYATEERSPKMKNSTPDKIVAEKKQKKTTKRIGW